MEKSFNQFAHLYLGCEIISDYYNITIDAPARLINVHWFLNKKFDRTICTIVCDQKEMTIEINLIIPLLKSVKFMTFKDKTELNKIYHEYINESPAEIEGRRVLYTTSNYYDLFNLISDGLAIEQTKI